MCRPGDYPPFEPAPASDDPPAFSVTLPERLSAWEIERILVALLREQERIRLARHPEAAG